MSFVEASLDTAPAEQVLNGKAEFGIGSSNLVLLRAQGHPVVALAAIYQHSPLILLTLKKRGIDSVHDLAKKRLMIEPHAAELFAYLQSESVLTEEITTLPHGYDIFALIENNVDAMSAYSTDEP